jgi:hypothetical protein
MAPFYQRSPLEWIILIDKTRIFNPHQVEVDGLAPLRSYSQPARILGRSIELNIEESFPNSQTSSNYYNLIHIYYFRIPIIAFNLPLS